MFEVIRLCRGRRFSEVDYIAVGIALLQLGEATVEIRLRKFGVAADGFVIIRYGDFVVVKHKTKVGTVKIGEHIGRIEFYGAVEIIDRFGKSCTSMLSMTRPK